MTTSDKQLEWMYRDLFIEYIKRELNPEDERIQNIIKRLKMPVQMNLKDYMSLLKVLVMDSVCYQK